MELQMHGGAGSVQLSDAVFGKDFNESLIHQVVTAYLAGGRAGTKAQKTRSAVSGGGAKPFRQKGTGRARAGTIRSPLWRGGGKTFAAVPRDHSQKVNKKMYRGAVCSILSELVRQGRLVVVDDFAVEDAKTRALVAKLDGMGLGQGKTLIVSAGVDEKLYLASRNLIDVDVREASALDPVTLVYFDKVLVTAGAVKMIEEWLA